MFDILQLEVRKMAFSALKEIAGISSRSVRALPCNYYVHHLRYVILLCI